MAKTTQRKNGAGHQVAMVFDLNKCIGCQTCSVACKVLWTRDEGTDYQWWCTVKTQPGRGPPRDYETMGGGYREGVSQPGRRPTREEWGGGWQFNYDEVLYGGKGQSVFLHPVGEEPKWGPNWDEDQGAGEYPNAYFFYMPRLCNHCTKPVCLEACPRGAAPSPPVAGTSPRASGPSPRRGGAAPPPACVRQCPGRAVWFGTLDNEDGPVAQLVRKWEVALPLHPEYGTEPNVFYIPPGRPRPPWE